MAAGASPWLALIWAGTGAAALRGNVPFSVTPAGWAMAFALGLVIAAPFAWVSRDRARLALWSASIALLMLACLSLTPAGWSIHEADTVLSPGWPVALVVLLFAAALWWEARRSPRIVTRSGIATGLISLVVLSAGAVWGARPPPLPVATGNSGPNIYQFVFDGMRSDMFDPAREAAAFPGFSHYPDNRANYVATDASLPSMFTGRFFEGGSFRAFQAQARAGGYRTALANAGYRASLYTPDRNRFWWLDTVHNPVTAQDMRRAVNDPSGWKMLLQTGLVEAAPPGLKRPFLEMTRLWWRWGVYNSYKQETGLLDRFLIDEAKRPPRGQYVYFHIMIPHPPYSLDADCRPAKTDYTTLAGCTRTMMRRIAQTLAKQGKLESSLVIFQGDHGFHADESNLPPTREAMPVTVRRKLLSINDSYKPDALIQRTRAMLVLHRPGAGGPLTVEPERSQLIDIAPTVAEAAGLNARGMVGRSLLRDNPQPRDWHFFAGVTSKTGLFRTRLGRDTDRGRIAHAVISGSGRWTLRPDIVVRGDGKLSGR